MNPTHRITFKLADGGQYIVFDVSFAKDEEELVYSVLETSNPMKSSLIKDAIDFLDKMNDLHKKYNGLKSVACMEVNYVDDAVAYDLEATAAAKKAKKK